MKNILKSVVLGLAIMLSSAALAQEEGRATFQKHCSPCHAPGLNNPGTLQLTLTRGEENGVLEERDNLVDVYVKTIVRQGLNGMPPFKPTIITNQQLDAVAAYLAN